MPAQSPTKTKRAAHSAPASNPFRWSIGIYGGSSPFVLSPQPEIINPVLSHEDVSDVPAAFVADPFMLKVDGRWYMFFEVLNSRSGKGEIGLAVSHDGLSWDYRQIVLDESFHLSYPYVFAWRGEYYMIPETLQPGAVRLYQGDPFPDRWALKQTLVEGDFADPSIFRFHDRWWLFACTTPYQHDTLRLYFADRLLGPWVEHPRSPIVEGNARIARPGGRVLVFDDRIVRFTQDCYPTYGSQVRAFEISILTPTDYREQEAMESPILKGSGTGWNRFGMHNVDLHRLGKRRWLACVDGVTRDERKRSVRRR